MADPICPIVTCISLYGKYKEECKGFVDECNDAAAYPVEVETSGGSFVADDPEGCAMLAKGLSSIGLKLISIKPAPGAKAEAPKASKPAPKAKPSSKPSPKPKAAPKPAPSKPTPPKSDPGDYSMCENHIGTKKRAACIEFVDSCRVITGWPYTVKAASSDGSVSEWNAENAGECIELAASLSDMGYKFFVPDTAPAPAPEAPADSKPSKTKKASAAEDKPKGVTDEYMRGPDPKLRLDELPKSKPLKFNSSLEHYYSARSCAQGEADLKKLCKKEKKEDSFIFIDGKAPDGKTLSFWYEIGINEGNDKTEAKVTESFTKGIMDDFSSITTYSRYHYHPVGGLDDYPSSTDYAEVLNVALHDKDKSMGYPAGIYDHRVVTEWGVWRMKPDFDYIRSHGEDAQAQAEKYQAELNSMVGFIMFKGGEVESCKAFAKKVTSPFIEVTFHPF